MTDHVEPIDKAKILVGDTVCGYIQSERMAEAGVAAIPLSHTRAYAAPGGIVLIANHDPADPAVTITKHIPARPDWAEALIVRFGECLYGHSGKTWTEIGGYSRSYSDVEFFQLARDFPENIEVVLGATYNLSDEPSPYDADCAWSSYRKEYAPNPDHLVAAHKAFHAGWDARTSKFERDHVFSVSNDGEAKITGGLGVVSSYTPLH